MPTVPKVFLSHSSTDKPRIVNRLDQLLRERGIDVWLDERELLPGKNLVEEIFTHGISKSDVFLVVLSANSIERSWVIEELSVAVVQKIAGVVKMIIPVVVDGVTVPDALKATVWEYVPDISRLDVHADRIADSIFGRMPAQIAAPPAYAGMPVHRIGNMTADDERIFAAACEPLIAAESTREFLDLRNLSLRMADLGMSEEVFWISIAALAQSFYLLDLGNFGDNVHPTSAIVNRAAFECYLANYRPVEYRSAKIAIISAIVNEGANHSPSISSVLRIHEYLVKHVLMDLESHGYIQATHASDGIHFSAMPTISRVLHALAEEV